MRLAFTLLILASLGCFCAALAAAQDESALRQKLAQTLLSEGPEQQRLLGQLTDSPSKLTGEVLNAWLRDGVYFYAAPDNSKVPVLLEDSEDAKGNARAIRIDNGQYLKDSVGVELRFGRSELPVVDTDMTLRSAIQQTLDMMALADPDPGVRRSAVLKLGNSRKQRYIAVLEGKLAQEPEGKVRKAIAEAVALLELGTTDPKVQLAAVNELARLRALGSLDNLKALVARPDCPPELARSARKAIGLIEDHLWWVNFFGTIFHGLSLGLPAPLLLHGLWERSGEDARVGSKLKLLPALISNMRGRASWRARLNLR